MNSNVRNLLLQIIEEKEVATSWGINNINIEENAISFSVNGLKYCGKVNITFKSIACVDITFADEHKTICSVDIFNVVSIIDREVEVTNNYCQSIMDWLHDNEQ